MSDYDEEARNPATPGRLRIAQQAGRIPISRELAGALAWTGAVAALMLLGPGLWESLGELVRSGLGGPVRGEETFDAISSHSWAILRGAMISLAVLILVIAATTAVATGLQTRFSFFPELVRLDLGRVHPAMHLRNLFSLSSWTTAFMGLLRFSILASLGFWVVAGDLPTLLAISGQGLNEGVQQTGLWTSGAILRLCIASVATGIGDYALRWWLHRRSLAMTDQEIRDERRSMEPPPEIDARRRLMRDRTRTRTPSRLH